MKNFILEVIAFLFILTLTVHLVSNQDKPIVIKALAESKVKQEIVNLGTSHGWDFDYSKSGYQGLNFNISGNTLYYDLQNYRFLRDKEYLAKNAIILIPVSYFVFGLDENRTDGAVGDAFNNQFYEYLPRRHIYSYSLRKEIELDVHKIQKKYHQLVHEDKQKNVAQNLKNIKDVEEFDNEAWAKTLEKLAINRVKHHKKLSTFSAEAKNIKYIETLLKEIKAAHHQAILVTTPYYCDYNENFGDEWLQKNYFDKMKCLASKYNIPYLDYSHDNRLTHNPAFFLDSDHLNPEGKALFNKFFFDDLASLNNISKAK